MYHVYLVTNLVNKKIYVGKAQNVSSRWSTHRWEARNGRQSYFKRAIRKYGPESFRVETLASFESESDAYAREVAEIASRRSADPSVGYNRTAGGGGSRGCSVPNSRNLKHGSRRRESTDRLYHSWQKIRQSGRPQAESWSSYVAFRDDVTSEAGPCPFPGAVLMRKRPADPDGPGNIRWGSKTELHRSFDNALILTAHGQSLHAIEWCERLGLKYNCVSERLKRGWTPESALTPPMRRPDESEKEWMRFWRSRGCSQQKIADAFGYSTATVSRACVA